MKTLIFAADLHDAERAARKAGLLQENCIFIYRLSDLRGRSTGGQPRIVTAAFRNSPGATKAMELCDLFPAGGGA